MFENPNQFKGRNSDAFPSNKKVYYFKLKLVFKYIFLNRFLKFNF